MVTNTLTGYEANIAANLARIIEERENLNPNRIAQAMKARGVPMEAKGISRIIEGTRRIKFNEAACLMVVLGNTTMDELTLDPRVASNRRARELLKAYESAWFAVYSAEQRAQQAERALRKFVDEQPDHEAIWQAVSAWARERVAQTDHDLDVDYVALMQYRSITGNFSMHDIEAFRVVNDAVVNSRDLSRGRTESTPEQIRDAWERFVDASGFTRGFRLGLLTKPVASGASDG